MSMSRVYKAREAAQYLGAHVETIRRLARCGEIPAFKVGKDWRFMESALERWAETHHLRSRMPHVLVVDDEEDILNFIQRILGLEGFRVSTATEGSHALEFIEFDPPDVVLLDLKMPGMNGPATLRALRKIDESLPVIIITGYPDSALMMEALNYSPLMVLPKPVRVKQVVETVDLALNGSKSKRALSESS